MGIFDDAIREHLELKRHSGADDEELKELEDEAFGPPARPGDPDFPGSTSEEETVDAPEGEFPAGDGGVFDAETTMTETPQDAVIDAPAAEEPALTPIDDDLLDDEPPTEAHGGLSSVEQPTEVAELPETAEESLPPEQSSFTTEEREAIADQPTVFFEQQPPAELELGDLELDIDEEIEEVGGAVSDPLPDEGPLIVEEAFADRASEAEVAEPPREAEPEPTRETETETEPEPQAPPLPEDAAPETSDFASPADGAETDEPETGDEDVLEETPEFLRDNPDDDELWFEQGEPKDFDF